MTHFASVSVASPGPGQQGAEATPADPTPAGRYADGSPARPGERRLQATVTASFQLDVVPALFSPDNDALASAWGPARRLVVVRDGSTTDRGELLLAYLREARRRGSIEQFSTIDAVARAAPSGLVDCIDIVHAAVKARLGRRDAFLALGGARTGRVVSVAAASFRRWTPAVRIQCDFGAVVAALRDGVRVHLEDDPVGVAQRSTRLILDAEALLGGAVTGPAEQAAVLHVALLDPELLDAAGTADPRAEALPAVLRLCRLGAGHRMWRLGDPWRALAPPAVSPAQRSTWSLLVATRVAGRLGLLPPGAVQAVATLVRQLDSGRSADAGGSPDDAAVSRWLNRHADGAGTVSVYLPTTDIGGQLLTVARRELAAALTGAGSAAAPPVRLAAPPVPLARRTRGSDAAAMTARTDTERPTSFPVRFVDGVLDPAGDALTDLLPAAQVLAVVDPYRADQVRRVRRALAGYRERGFVSRFAILAVSADPRSKTVRPVSEVVHAAEGLGLGERDRILAVGGGTVLDIAGYAAHLYRGATPYVRIPTTLVGMIDAGIGLKVGVNVDSHKNLLGAYHPPLACLCDVSFLATLSRDELRCGLAEAIKIGLVCDSQLLDLIDRAHGDVLAGRDTPDVRTVLDRAVHAMLRQLELNPFEDNLRRLPDFGHEFAHALESLSGYRLRHGEAVAIGMALSCQLAAFAGYLAEPELDRILSMLDRVGLRVYDPVCDPAVLWRKLLDDVIPHKAGNLHLVVPRRIGEGDFIDSIDDLSPQMLRDACAALRARTADRPR